jgi:hypothetical protein
MVACPVCNTTVRSRNLERHLKRVRADENREQEACAMPVGLDEQTSGAHLEALPAPSNAAPHRACWVPEREERLFARILDPNDQDEDEVVEVRLFVERAEGQPTRRRCASVSLLLLRALPALGAEVLLHLQNEDTGACAELLVDEPNGAPGGLELELTDEELVEDATSLFAGGGEVAVHLSRSDGSGERAWLRFELPAPHFSAELSR